MSKSIQLKKQNENVYPHPYYPIGSIYLSVVNTNPSRWFGGTWEQIAKGRTLVGVDTNDTDFNTVKKTGGSKELQKHAHTYVISGNVNPTSHSYYSDFFQYYGWGTSFLESIFGTGEAGTGNSGNLQPYFTCYIWCRTA